jgi:hypothetical protein
MDIQCNLLTIYSESTSDGRGMYVEITADDTEADDIFDCIKNHVDHEAMMNCLDESEVREYFGFTEDREE